MESKRHARSWLVCLVKLSRAIVGHIYNSDTKFMTLNGVLFLKQSIFPFSEFSSIFQADFVAVITLEAGMILNVFVKQ